MATLVKPVLEHMAKKHAVKELGGFLADDSSDESCDEIGDLIGISDDEEDDCDVIKGEYYIAFRPL